MRRRSMHHPRIGSPWRLALGACISLCLTACGSDHDDNGPRALPTAGLYTPGSTLGASDPTDVPRAGMGLGERCVALSSDAADGGGGVGVGKLDLDYQTQTLMGRYAPKNCTAVWIETVAGQYVATLEVTAGLRRPGLVYWQEHACTKELGPDAVTSATLRDHQKPHSLEWDGLDFQSKPTADGPYKLFIEVTESDKEPGELSEFDFEKGTTMSMDAPVDAQGPLVSVHWSWSQMPQMAKEIIGDPARGN